MVFTYLSTTKIRRVVQLTFFKTDHVKSCVNGPSRPVFSKGRLKGERVKYVFLRHLPKIKGTLSFRTKSKILTSVRQKGASSETEYSAKATETESENSIFFFTISTTIFLQKMKMNFLFLI
jgi:hypothetical protein